MNITITNKISRDNAKKWYYLEWGKQAGQRVATGVFTYTKPKEQLQKKHNKEALAILEAKRSQLVIEAQSIGTGYIPLHKYKSNFLDFYTDFVHNNRKQGNRHLEGSLKHFKSFLGREYISPMEITEDLCLRFRRYLLNGFNGDTPSNYFSRYKKMLKAATKQGYFRINPAEDIAAKANKNKRRKENLEAEEYIQLLKTPCLNNEVKEAFVFCLYTALRWCDVKPLKWATIKENTIVFYIVQEKTTVEHRVTLHPVAKAILNERRKRMDEFKENIFELPTADGANKVLKTWCKNAGISKHVTWHCARLSFSILLQDAKVDPATVALLLGQTTTKYVYETYKRHRLVDNRQYVEKLPCVAGGIFSDLVIS